MTVVDDRLALALKYYQSNLDEQAWALVSELVNEPDPSMDVLSMAATMAFERRDLDDAVSYCDRLLSLQENDSHTLLIKGRALSDLGRNDEALDTLQAAVKADDSLAAAHYNLGWVRQAVGDVDGARLAYRAAVARQDPYPVAWNNLGLVLEQAGDAEGAAQAFRTAIRQFPQFSLAHNNLGALLAAGGHFRAAASAYEEAISVDPSNLDADVNLGVATLEQGDIAAAVVRFQHVLSIAGEHAAATDNVLYAEVYRSDDGHELRKSHQSAGDRLAKPLSPQDLITNPDPSRALRMGFLSPDFRRHSVSFFSLPLIRSLAAAGINTILFNASTKSDAITDAFRAAADTWHDVAGLADDDLVSLIRGRSLDCLVDFAGRTTGNRISALAQRLAPIQITALGYPGPTGLAAMDYWLCDAITNPPEAGESFDRDRPLRLERGMHVFDPPADAPDVSSLPALQSAQITFGSFNKLAKISDATIELWSSILKAVDGSRLLVKARALVETDTVVCLLNRFDRAGIDVNRIETHGWTVEDQDHLALYHKVDIALDTVPYNGTTTTCEALWMGVPVLTLCGRSHAARVGASLLTSAGLEDWIAASSEYAVSKAQNATQDLEALSVLRANLRDKIKVSALTDERAAARSFERATRGVWRELCSR